VLADYEGSVGQVLKLLGAYSGHEIGNPAKIAQLIVSLSDRQDLPARLLLGADALHVSGQSENQRGEEAARWRKTALSVHFDDAQLPPELKALWP
jgi:hypothetical protein